MLKKWFLEKVLITEIPKNTAYRINKAVVHPGDSLGRDLLKWKGVKALALPITAPWTTQPEVARFAEDMKPEIAIPIHDGFIKNFFSKRQNEICGKYFAKRGIHHQPLNEFSESIEA